MSDMREHKKDSSSSFHRGNHGKVISHKHTSLCFVAATVLFAEMTALFALLSYPEVKSVLNNKADNHSRNLAELRPAHNSVNGRPPQIPAVVLSERLSENDHSITPHVAWLMSFPNSGTSFTLHMTRMASNSTTATNYGTETDIKDKSSAQAIRGEAGANGPFLLEYPNVHTTMPTTILTKTHCSTALKDIVSHTAFLAGCVSGKRLVFIDDELKTVSVAYSPSLVRKAIHLFRDPLNNIVSRFHLARNTAVQTDDHDFLDRFANSKEGFRAWCENDGKSHRNLLGSSQVALWGGPCFTEFFRYVQWHNLAFAVTQHLNIPTLVFHYHEYEQDFPAARETILSFLDSPLVNEVNTFIPGKTYHDYYTRTEKKNIRVFLKEFASAETWDQLKVYDFK